MSQQTTDVIPSAPSNWTGILVRAGQVRTDEEQASIEALVHGWPEFWAEPVFKALKEARERR